MCLEKELLKLLCLRRETNGLGRVFAWGIGGRREVGGSIAHPLQHQNLKTNLIPKINPTSWAFQIEKFQKPSNLAWVVQKFMKWLGYIRVIYKIYPRSYQTRRFTTPKLNKVIKILKPCSCGASLLSLPQPDKTIVKQK